MLSATLRILADAVSGGRAAKSAKGLNDFGKGIQN
jgi:hypothetical protein